MKVVQCLSGGLDSATLLAYLRHRGHEVRAVGYDYGQRHHRELDYATRQAIRQGVHFERLSVAGISRALRGNALIDRAVDVPSGHHEDPAMLATVVPNRNMILIAMAIAYAEAVDFEAVAVACHAGDQAIYPDCRPEFIEAISAVAKLGTFNQIQVFAPFQHLTKTEIAAIGQHLKVDHDDTWSCYQGLAYPCGSCGACTERQDALRNAAKVDPDAVLRQLI